MHFMLEVMHDMRELEGKGLLWRAHLVFWESTCDSSCKKVVAHSRYESLSRWQFTSAASIFCAAHANCQLCHYLRHAGTSGVVRASLVFSTIDSRLFSQAHFPIKAIIQ
jgi:hypothetical protein